MHSLSPRSALGALLALVLAMTALAISPAAAAGAPRAAVTVTITNLAPTDGTFQTPFWAAIHNGRFDVYDGNQAASAALERLAEDGNTAPLSDAFSASSARGQQTTIAGPNGPIFSGDTASYTFIVDPTARSSRFFSYASMVIPSNDAFVANGLARRHRLFDASGEFVAENFTITGAAVLDAGTEVNDELPENTAALAQAAPDTGVTENGVVRSHAGFASGGNVLAAIPGGDFTQPGYELARVEFSVDPIASSVAVSRLKGANEVPAVSTEATGRAVVRLTESGAVKARFRATNTSGVTAAHIHMGAPGENGPVVAVLYSDPDGTRSTLRDASVIAAADLMGPLEGMSVAALWDLIESREAYINVHSIGEPAGELRGNLRTR